ncbi:hypothetical protein ABT187_04525 [Streptomyces sp. NPDC001817]|uniref:hypothetical protein n=1 Tax=Streptomyces sp. NPDC001817 TaxID=3154398 RepID=UPI00332CAC77
MADRALEAKRGRPRPRDRDFGLAKLRAYLRELQLGTWYVDTDSAAGLVVLTGQASNSIADQALPGPGRLPPGPQVGCGHGCDPVIEHVCDSRYAHERQGRSAEVVAP